MAIELQDECWIEEHLSTQKIGADVFLPFLLARLQTSPSVTSATLKIELFDVGGVVEHQQVLRLRWHQKSLAPLPLAVQERVVTEWAACGMACILLSLYTDFRLSQVAVQGDRFDYWVSNGTQELALEVSGTLLNDHTDFKVRRRVKARQLASNPHGVDGFAVVVGFALKQAVISFHQFGELVR